MPPYDPPIQAEPPEERALVRRMRGVAERKQRVCAAAARLFAHDGFEAATASRLNAAAKLTPSGFANLFASREEVLADLLTTHVLELMQEVGAAHDAARAGDAAASPARGLEMLLRAFLDAVAQRPDAHRAFLFCVHRLPEAPRSSVLLRFQIVLEWMRDELVAAVPALAADSVAQQTLLETIRALLSDPWRWPSPVGPEQRQRDARRIAGMLLAAARAETEGYWPLLGGTSGAPARPPIVAVDIRAARARFGELLRATEHGADITILRRTRPVARLVSVR